MYLEHLSACFGLFNLIPRRNPSGFLFFVLFSYCCRSYCLLWLGCCCVIRTMLFVQGTLKSIPYRVGLRHSKTALLDGLFFDWILLGFLLVVRSSVSRFHSCCALCGGGGCDGVLLYGSQKSVGSSVLRAFSASNASY